MHALCRRVFHNFGQRRLVMGSLALFRELALLADVVCLSASVTAKWPTQENGLKCRQHSEAWRISVSKTLFTRSENVQPNVSQNYALRSLMS